MRWLGVLVAVLAAPAAAHGSTVTMEQRYEPGHRGPDYIVATAHVRAAPGEANAMAVRFEGADVVIDDAAGVQAGTGCAAGAPNQARCEAPPGAFLWVDVDTADGDDEVSLSAGVTGRLALGEGDDRATAPGTATADGGPGNDVLAGGPGAQTLEGGPGNDDIAGAAGDDYLDGGAAPTGSPVARATTACTAASATTSPISARAATASPRRVASTECSCAMARKIAPLAGAPARRARTPATWCCAAAASSGPGPAG